MLSVIDVLTPWEESLMKLTAGNREYFHFTVMNVLSEIAGNYNGKVVDLFKERFVCYFPQISDSKNLMAFQDGFECSIVK